MSTHYIQNYASLTQFAAFSPARPNNHVSVGGVDGALWANFGNGPVPLGQSGFGESGVVRYVNPAKSGAYQTIQAAVDASGQGDTILIAPKEGDASAGDTDPDSYAENVTVGEGKDGLSLVGIGRGLGQGPQPQIRPGTGSSPLITVEAFGVAILGLTLNGASNTGGGIKVVADGSTKDAGGLIVAGCHIKNCKGSGAAATGGGIFWTTSGAAWYVSIYNNEFIDCRAGVVMPGTGISIPRHVKIVGNRFGAAANTTVDADIYVAADGILDLFIDRNVFATVDVPAYASSPTAARYVSLGAGTSGLLSNNFFACVVDPDTSPKTFGASGSAAVIPTTVRMAGNYGEAAAASGQEGIIGRT
jgi:hypothetical protein